jgi:hypothetical protein
MATTDTAASSARWTEQEGLLVRIAIGFTAWAERSAYSLGEDGPCRALPNAHHGPARRCTRQTTGLLASDPWRLPRRATSAASRAGPGRALGCASLSAISFL